MERAGNAEAGGGSITTFYTVSPRATTSRTRSPTPLAACSTGTSCVPAAGREGRCRPSISSFDQPGDTAGGRGRHLATPSASSSSGRATGKSRPDPASVPTWPAAMQETDLAIARFPVMRQFLRQGLDENESLAESRARLASRSPAGRPQRRAEAWRSARRGRRRWWSM
ncbi:hypothetical protein ACPA9J_12750 [Pseudomonas aeruginosa]